MPGPPLIEAQSFYVRDGVSFLEMLVMFLQAYVFTLLSSMYIGEALADEH